jgi:hypothetical protein
MATVALSTGLGVVPGVAAGSTFTGKVSDAMCGAKHTEGGIAPADCVRACVQKGAKPGLRTRRSGRYSRSCCSSSR